MDGAEGSGAGVGPSDGGAGGGNGGGGGGGSSGDSSSGGSGGASGGGSGGGGSGSGGDGFIHTISYEPDFYPDSVTAKLKRFAPHQPRIDHHLYYEGEGCDLLEVSQNHI